MPLPTRCQKLYAHRKVRTEIEAGRLVRPSSCERCGATPITADGRAAIQAHHHDHRRPLDVEWLCASCHRRETPLPSMPPRPMYGEKNGQSKLTVAAVLSAIEMRRQGETISRISRELGVSRSTIRDAIEGRTWLAARQPQEGEDA